MSIVPFHAPEDSENPAPETDGIAAAIDVERIVIGFALQSTEVARQVLALVKPSDFIDLQHGRILEALSHGFAKGRENPSHEFVVATLDNDEFPVGADLRAYLKRCVDATFDYATNPDSWRDAVAEMRAYSDRRALADLGRNLVTAPDDAADLVVKTQAALDEITTRMRSGRVTSYTVHEAALAAIASLDEKPDSPTTGFIDLDRMLGGWPRGQLSVVAARPGMGKSAFAVAAGHNAARAGNRVLMFSLEMMQVQVGARLITDMAYTGQDPVHYDSIINRRVDAIHERRLAPAAARLENLPMRVEEQRGLTLADIVARTRRQAAELQRNGQRLDVVIVDHLGLIRPSNRYAGNRVREVAEISDGLSTLAKDLRIAVLALSQLNRGVEGRENKRPSLADLRDSGAIEEDASLVLFLYRPAYYLQQKADDPVLDEQRMMEFDAKKHLLEVIVSKNRNGRSGAVSLYIDAAANAVRNQDYAR